MMKLLSSIRQITPFTPLSVCVGTATHRVRSEVPHSFSNSVCTIVQYIIKQSNINTILCNNIIIPLCQIKPKVSVLKII